MWRAILSRLNFQRSRKANPLMRDAEYARLDALERACRRAHMPVAHISAAKRERVQHLLQRPGAKPVSRISILNILGA